jgi:hypothetical protein
MLTLKRSLFLSPFLIGCYTYSPIEPATAPVGTEVRAHISGAASDRIAPIIQAFNTRVLTGKIDENRSGDMVLEVPTGAILNTGDAIAPLISRVPLQRGDVVQLETRRLNGVRTSLMIGSIAAAVGVASYLALNAGSSGGTVPPDGGGGQPINRVPIFRLHF